MKNKKWFLVTVIGLVMIALSSYVLFDYIVKDISVKVDDKEESIRVTSNTVEEALDELQIELSENDYINIGLEEKIADDTEIVIKKAVPVTINVDSKTIEVESTFETVSEVLESIDIIFDDNDKVSPGIDEKIKSNMEIEITRIDEKIRTETMEISYRKTTKYNDKLEVGYSRKIQTGKPGVRKTTIKEIYEDGELVSETILTMDVISVPIPEIIEMGKKDRLVTSRGSVRFTKSVSMAASAYDLSYQSTGKNPGDAGYGITATGTKARPGVVAVDPKVIPLGTRLYIKSLDGSKDYGFAVAEDTGGAIKGNRIDLFFESHKAALAFGRRKVKVYILGNN